MKLLKNLPMLIAFFLILVAGIIFYFAITGVQNLEKIMVANSNIGAMQPITGADVREESVPKSSITENDMTVDEWNKKKEEFKQKADSELFVIRPLLSGQRIDARLIPKTPQESFSVVSGDERVVAVGTTLSGAVVGTIQAGDVVDVSVSGNDGVTVRDAKVLCIADKPNACTDLNPGGQTYTVDQDKNGPGQDKALNVLLAVPDDVSAIAGKLVSLALNPFCRVDEKGYFYSVRDDPAHWCRPDDSRDASVNPKYQQANEKDSTTGSDSTSTSETTPTDAEKGAQ